VPRESLTRFGLPRTELRPIHRRIQHLLSQPAVCGKREVRRAGLWTSSRSVDASSQQGGPELRQAVAPDRSSQTRFNPELVSLISVRYNGCAAGTLLRPLDPGGRHSWMTAGREPEFDSQARSHGGRHFRIFDLRGAFNSSRSGPARG